ncbi:hypothetical protein [Aeromonas caviae]|uniref:hypothetical protein n=1 Tax=Aeromonas caviae TaxID=648 RepID=UPI0029D88099|nr:hypothetical protein [Aeromonas caviae]MDX7711797.1 hypothetical protein [Aeromonas caviae]
MSKTRKLTRARRREALLTERVEELQAQVESLRREISGIRSYAPKLFELLANTFDDDDLIRSLDHVKSVAFNFMPRPVVRAQFERREPRRALAELGPSVLTGCTSDLMMNTLLEPLVVTYAKYPHEHVWKVHFSDHCSSLAMSPEALLRIPENLIVMDVAKQLTSHLRRSVGSSMKSKRHQPMEAKCAN